MENAEFTKTQGKYKLEILHDEDCPWSPRENDNIGKMIFFHGRYNLGDKHTETVDSLKEIIARKDVVSLPVYMYDHSGITIKTGPFSCPWDSGQLGHIYMTKADYRENWGKRFNRKKALACLEGEVKEYDDFLTGNVWGYKVTDTETEEVVDSCWGFIGDLKYAKQEGLSLLKHYAETEKKEAAKVKAMMHV